PCRLSEWQVRQRRAPARAPSGKGRIAIPTHGPASELQLVLRYTPSVDGGHSRARVTIFSCPRVLIPYLPFVRCARAPLQRCQCLRSETRHLLVNRSHSDPQQRSVRANLRDYHSDEHQRAGHQKHSIWIELHEVTLHVTLPEGGPEGSVA